MKSIYKSISVLDKEIEGKYIDSNGDNLNSLDNLSLVNIFIGANNSGKSRLLRYVANKKDIEHNLREPDTEKCLRYIRELSLGLNEIKNRDHAKGILAFSVRNGGVVNTDSFAVLENKFINSRTDFFSFVGLLNMLGSNEQFSISSHQGGYDLDRFKRDIEDFLDANQEKVRYVKEFKLDKIAPTRYYLPIIRSLNSFQEEMGMNPYKKDDVNDIFLKRTVKVYKIDHESTRIFTGQDLYFVIRDLLLGEKQDRAKVANYESFLKEEVFAGQEVSMVPNIQSDVLYIKIGDAAERPIYNLGDGIQSLIILTFPMFMEDSGIFCIEEPETHLHPGMQRKFLELILNNSSKYLSNKRHQYFITTHSNHFLDLTLDHKDISIYKFSSKGDTKTVELVSSSEETVLKELGVKNSSVFITNSTIWVEGITDRLYIKKFLELYQASFGNGKKRVYEDIDYSFVEYGGNNITHWSFLDSASPTICVERLCGKSFLITDKDGENKNKRHSQLKSKLGAKRYECLKCREIENILSLKSLSDGIRGFARDKDYELPDNISNCNYAQEKIGNFIDKKLKPTNQYKTKSGSLPDEKKLVFCQSAIKNMEYKDLSRKAINLTRKIYNFICENQG